MASAKGDALDWALALASAPGERLVLRQRPLPEGMGSLLQIAARNSGDVLSSALARTGETEQGLVEAVRFYLREVLFHSGADAYRILGLERGASGDQAKAHHRWLQQWLHPDRHTSDWDAIFAGRVNAAWNQLRTDERRRAYDAEHPAERVIPAAPASPVMAAWVHDSLPAQSPRQRWQRRLPLLALLVACVGLGVLALRDLARDEVLVAAAPDRAGAGDVADPAGRGDATLDPFGNLHIPERVAAPVSKARPVPASAARNPLPVARARVATREDYARTASLVRVLTPAAVLPRTVQAPMTRKSPLEASVPVGNTPPKLAATLVVASPPRTTIIAPVMPPLPPAPVKTSPPPTQAAPPRLAIATAAPSKPPVPIMPSAFEPTAPRPAAPKPATTVKVPAVAAERVRQAQQVGDRLLAFMRRPGTSVPPIWDSLSAQQGAAQLRDGLLADGSAGFAQAEWRVAERDAQMQVAIRYADGRTGHLNAGLVWREQRWLVSRLNMERDW